MSITDELRNWVHEAENDGVIFVDPDSPHSDIPELLGIADRIDERHEKELERMWDEAEGADPDGFLYGDYVKLPVGADGVPIHVGDELTNGEDLPAKVRCMVLDESGWMVSTRELRSYGVLPATLRHVKPDSWERIIEDAANFALDTQHVAGRISLEPFVERCRRLAGEAE